MKRLFFSISVCLLGMQAVIAQEFDDIQKEYLLNQTSKAKTDIDKAMGNSKFASKAQSWMLKSCIYAALSMDPANKSNPASFDLANEADAAFNKYREMEPSMKLVTDPMYENGPINIYSFLYNAGYESYKKNKWDEGYSLLKKALKYSDILIQDTIIKSKIDTNLLILAGVTAENSNHKDDAFKYYGKLAENKVTGQGFESVYKFLVSQSFQNKDMAAFDKYKTLGKELYPKSDYFSYDKVDFANGLDSTFEGKMKALEEILSAEPNNYKANEFLGEDIYDALIPKDDKIPLPANPDALEAKMINSFNKASVIQPTNEVPILNVGNYFINKSLKVDKERKDFNAELKTKYKPGTPVSKEDAAKRDALDKKYLDILDQARPPYEKAADLFKSKTSLTLTQKAQYKSIVTSLSDIALYKQTYYKGKPAEVAKYTAEQKKWDAVYDSIK